MLVFSKSVSVKVAKSLTLTNSKSAYLTIYADGSGNVFYSEDGVPPEWQEAKNRKDLKPVARLFVEDDLLTAENLTHLPVSSVLVKLITEQYSVDYLLAAKFLTSEMMSASVNNMKERITALSQAIEAMYANGLEESQIRQLLNVSKEDEEELNPIFNALPKFDSNRKALKQKTIDTTAETIPTPTAKNWLKIDTVDAWIALENSDKRLFSTDELRKIAKTLGVTLGKGRKSVDKLIEIIDNFSLAAMTPQ